MLSYFLVGLHILVGVILILVVLLQTGKSADLAGAFGGGGSQTAFGSRGAATFLSKITTSAAVLFMISSFSLAILSARGLSSVLDQTGVPIPAAAPDPGAAPVAGAPDGNNGDGDTPTGQPGDASPPAEGLDAGDAPPPGETDGGPASTPGAGESGAPGQPEAE